MNYTLELAKFLASLNAENISEKDYNEIRYKFLDWLGCVIGAQRSKSSDDIKEIVSAGYGDGDCTVLGMKKTYSLYGSAFANAAISFTLDCDDTNTYANAHPGVDSFPAALAVSEHYGKTFGEFAAAAAAGYEALVRVGGALLPTHYDYWHSTGTVGAFAATATVANLLGFTPEETARSFGMVATTASGLICVLETEAKLLTAGNAVSNGILAAEMVRKGISAPLDVIEHPINGYSKVANGAGNFPFMIPKPDDGLMLWTSRYRTHAACGQTHAALDCLQDILQETPFTAADVVSIRANVYKLTKELVGEFKNKSHGDANFSLPYGLASMVLHGKLTIAEYAPELLNSPAVLDLNQKITVVENDSYTAAYPAKRMASVVVTLKDGRVLEKSTDYPRGCTPPRSFIESKFMSLATMAISKQSAEEIMRKVLSLDRSASVVELGAFLRERV